MLSRREKHEMDTWEGKSCRPQEAVFRGCCQPCEEIGGPFVAALGRIRGGSAASGLLISCCGLPVLPASGCCSGLCWVLDSVLVLFLCVGCVCERPRRRRRFCAIVALISEFLRWFLPSFLQQNGLHLDCGMWKSRVTV